MNYYKFRLATLEVMMSKDLAFTLDYKSNNILTQCEKINFWIAQYLRSLGLQLII